MKYHFDEHTLQKDVHMKEAAILVTYLEDTVLFFPMHSRNEDREEKFGLFLKFLYVIIWI